MAGRMEGPLVKTVDGLLRGKVAQSVWGGSYFSFQGIPYAQPPVGPLRFQAPKQVQPWSGEREALKEGSSAPSCVFGTNRYMESSSEDCLYLNVYTTQLPQGDDFKKRPVMVWIHGGLFYSGSGDTDFYGPDHLIRNDVVLITINYRLGALGFLSLQNEACPGNNGMKDQVEALRWVQRNVAAFGGDANNVTIFGESAGGAATQYLMLSPLSRGLFHRAISQSGSVLSPWASSRQPVQYAFKLGELLGFKTDDKEKLLKFLMTVPPRAIVEKAGKNLMHELEPEYFYLSAPFVPVVEPDLPGAFISEPLEKLVKEGKFHDVPYIVGLNTIEGLVVTIESRIVPLVTNDELSRLLPIHPKLRRGSPLADAILENIKRFYFTNGFDKQKCVDALSSIYFLYGNYEALQGLANAESRKSKTFFYQFTYDGGLGYYKALTGYQDWEGTFHGDELGYMLYSNLMKPEVKPGSDDERMMKTLCQLWTDFASSGDPTPETHVWPPYSNTEKAYLDIGLNLRPAKDLKGEEMRFWTENFARINRAGH